MASRIAGITIEIGGDTTNLQKSLKGVDASIRSTQSALKDVNNLLKLDPTNTDLLRQKQQLLRDTVEQTKQRLEQLKQAQAQMDASGVDKNSAEYQALQREIIATEQALKKAQAAANGFHPSLERIKASAQKASEGLKEAAAKTRALSTAAAAALTSIGALGYKAMATADDLLTLSAQTGISTTQLQQFSYAADRVDVSVDSIAKAVNKLKTKIDPTNKTLAQLGVSAVNADESLRDASDVFFDVLQALSKVENETERDQLAMELFGKSANELATIIDDGGESLRKYSVEASKVGAVMSKETLQALGEMNDEIDKLKAQGMAVLIQTGAKALKALSPLLKQVADGVGKIFAWLSTLSPETLKMIAIVLTAVAAISPLLSILGTLASAIAFLASPVGIAVAAIVALIAIGVALWKNWDTIKSKASAFASTLRTNFNNIKTSVSSTFSKAKSDAVDAWNGIKKAVSDAVDNVKSSVSSGLSNIASAIASPFITAKNNVSSAVNTIKNLFPIKLGKIFSDIKLPEFKISGGEAPWGIGGQGVKPSIDIVWHKKAMRQPYLLDGATIFGAMGNKLLGGGEAGKEVIMSYDHYKNISNGDNISINVYAAPNQSAKAIADEVQRVLVAQQRQRNRAYA